MISVLEKIIEMKMTSDDESYKSQSVDGFITPTTVSTKVKDEPVKGLRETSTQYSLQSNFSSYEVIDASMQVSSSSTTSDDGSGDMYNFSMEWKEVVCRDTEGTNSNDTVTKEKAVSSQSPQDMIEILKKAVKEGNVKAQESVQEFFQPTLEDLQTIRRGSLYFTKVSTQKS